jgi:hypothetical protein
LMPNEIVRVNIAMNWTTSITIFAHNVLMR